MLHNLNETYVLLRFFKISEEEKLKNRIAEYTNSQNAISSADLKSVDAIQIQIEKYFKEEKILYARKAGKQSRIEDTWDDAVKYAVSYGKKMAKAVKKWEKNERT